MTDPTAPVLSVRGEARRTVTPDSVFLPGALTVSAGSKPDALREAAVALESLTGDLRALGGTPLTPETERRPLTWSAYSASTHDEINYDAQTGEKRVTGRVTARVAIITTVRDFGLLDQLSATLAQHAGFAIQHASWNVDADNPAWPEVRAAAIHSAIRKGRDYATALGGSLLQVLHIADAGLLGAEGPGDPGMRRTGGSGWFPSAATATSGGLEPDAPSLDPVPQELVAVIDARFTATGVSLVDE